MVPALVVASLGTLLVLASIVQLWGRKIVPGAVDDVVLKLVHARNYDRIAKFAEAAPDSYAGVLAAAVKAGQIATAEVPGRQHGLPAGEIRQTIHAAFDRTGSELESRWRTISLRGLIGAALGGIGLYLGYTAHYSSQTLRSLGGLSALAGVYFLFHLADIRRALASGRETVLPEIDRAFIGEQVES